MKKNTIAIAIAGTLAFGTTAVTAAPITSMSISEFGFANGHANSYEGGSDDSAAEQINLPINMGTFQGSPGWDPLTTAPGTGADKNAGIVGFDFSYFGPVAGFTSPDNLIDEANPQFGVYSAPSGDVTGSSVTLDMSSWTAGWSGAQFNQGGTTSGTMSISNFTDNGGGSYTFDAVWTSLIVGGPFDNSTWHWGMTLTASTAPTIPVPAAVWLFGSGLLGLAGVARSRKEV